MMTLFEIERGLAELIEHRADRLLDTESPPSPEEIQEIDEAINRYECAEPVKVSGIVGIFRWWKSQREIAAAEAKRYRGIVAAIELMEERLKERVGAVLELLPKPAKGSRTLAGRDGSKIFLKGNGGIEPLQIDGWDTERWRWMHDGVPVLPSRYQQVTVVMSLQDWQRINSLPDANVPTPLAPVFAEPNTALIREAVAEACPGCGGSGKAVCSHCRIAEEHLPPGGCSAAAPLADTHNFPVCTICAGTGKKVVPGARLLPRGSHVEFR